MSCLIQNFQQAQYKVRLKENTIVNNSCVVYLQNLHICLFSALKPRRLIFYALMVEVNLIVSNISDNSVNMFNKQKFLCVLVL